MKTFSQLAADVLQAEAIKDAMTYDMPTFEFSVMHKACNNLLDSAEDRVSDLPELEDRQDILKLIYVIRCKEIKKDFTFKNR